MIKKDRLEALTDGIIAIAATIMVLELILPGGGRFIDLLSNWPTFLAYITSFSVIYVTWYNHNRIFDRVEYITKDIFMVNGLWIFLCSMIPFTTGWVGSYPDWTAPELLYTVHLTLYSMSFRLLDRVIVKNNPGSERHFTSKPVFRILMYSGMGAAMIVSFFAPLASMVIVLAVNIVSLIFLWVQ